MAGSATVESVAGEVHLYVLRESALQVGHHRGYAREDPAQVWQIGHCGLGLRSYEGVAIAEVKLESLLATAALARRVRPRGECLLVTAATETVLRRGSA